MTGRLNGRVAIVTGAGRGIGRAEALKLAAEGARVLVNDSGTGPDGVGADAGPADDLANEIRAHGGEAVASHDSVTSASAGEALVEQALDQWGRLDILINNAGVARGGMIYNAHQDDWDALLAINLSGHFTVTRPASEVFRRQGSGRIITTSSHAGLGFRGNAAYSASKEGVVGFTRTVARDLAPFGVTVNCIRPAAATRLTADAKFPAEYAAEKVASVAVWLCTDAAAAVTGQDIGVVGDHISVHSRPAPVATAFRAGGWDLDSLDAEFIAAFGHCVDVPGTFTPTPGEFDAARRNGWD